MPRFKKILDGLLAFVRRAPNVSGSTDLEGQRARFLEQVSELYGRTLTEDEVRKFQEAIWEGQKARFLKEMSKLYGRTLTEDEVRKMQEAIRGETL